MKYLSNVVTILVLGGLPACAQLTDSQTTGFIQRTISVSELPAELDTALTFEHLPGGIKADSVLQRLTEANVPIRRAWMPLDNRCMDPIGPTLTVELRKPGARMSEFNFKKGTGRLVCSTRLILFTAIE